MSLALPRPRDLRLVPPLAAVGGVVALVAVAALIVERFWLAAVQPLWFDEAWALAVATCPDWRSVVHEALTDVNAPLYEFVLHAWTAVAGPSNFALRLPSLLCVLAAATLPLASRLPGLTRESRLAWAALLFAWWGVDLFLAGRCYGLLLLISTAQVLAFAELIRRPSRKAALAWCALGALAILTHYYALIVTVVQGVAYLALARRDALRTWPAALAFIPAFAWIAAHAPRLAAFSDASVAWHGRLGASDALGMAGFALFPSAPLLGLAGAAALAVGGAASRSRGKAPPAPWIAAAASVCALGLSLLSGVLHPSLTARYLIPTVPGLLLGLVLVTQACPRPRLAAAGLALGALVLAVRPGAFAEGLRSRAPYGFETASQVLMRHGVTDVAFAWDHEVTALMPPDTLARVGGVFLKRAGSPARLHPVIVRPSDNLNLTLPAAASGPRPGLIWIYNRAGRTAAAAHAPQLDHTAGWACERIGDENVGSLACWRP